ncbi:MAG: type II secretion system protein GspH [Betaproteobacteria bacterium HGW-Betaproteobacteria-13]|jgi:type IV fimbrial biogenesis protein FimT|nr:MAG: type II secretion system protein GspH [Betaproteobacteria bacterium HGW-Betaproteobacteria-13]
MQSKHGFTLIEMMITLAVLAIVTALAAPSFRGVLLDNRVSTWSSEFISALNTARSEAIRRGVLVSVVPAAGGYANGWTITPGTVVVAGTEINVKTFSVANDASLTGSTGVTVTFGRLGNMTSNNFVLNVDPIDCTTGQQRRRVISASSTPNRPPRVARDVCP